MSGFLNALSQGSDLMRDSKAPVDTDGAASVPSFLSKKMKDTPDVPAVSLSDLVWMAFQSHVCKADLFF
jgi:hypothetical protein